MSSDTEVEKAQKAWNEAQQKLWSEKAKAEARLSIPYRTRQLLATSISFIAGGALGIAHGAQTSGMRFRAENAHRLPTNQKGWFFYHKSKNYVMVAGGAREGLKMGARIGFWGSSFFVVEEAIDRFRETKDFVNTVMASLAVSGGFSLWNRFPLATAARTAKTGLAVGLAYGLVQDLLGELKGRRPGYVDWLLRARQRRADTEVEPSTTGGVVE